MKNYRNQEFNELLDKLADYTEVVNLNIGTTRIFNYEKLQQFKRDHGLIKEALEVGVWYKQNNGSLNFKGEDTCYGFNVDGEWIEDNEWFGTYPAVDWEKATHKEAKDALIEYWEKDNEGFKDYTFNDNGGLIGWSGSEPMETLFKGGTWFPIAKKTTRQPLEHEVLTEAEKVEIMWNERNSK